MKAIKEVIKSELNWDFIKNNTDENNLDKFYDELLKIKFFLFILVKTIVLYIYNSNIYVLYLFVAR